MNIDSTNCTDNWVILFDYYKLVQITCPNQLITAVIALSLWKIIHD